jgi:hypothetical protein
MTNYTVKVTHYATFKVHGTKMGQNQIQKSRTLGSAFVTY